MYDSYAGVDGGFIYSSASASTTINFNQMSTYYYSRAVNNGGMIWVNSPSTTLNFIENAKLEYVSA